MKSIAPPKYVLLTAFFIAAFTIKTFAQTAYTVRGSIQDTSGIGLPGSVIKLISGSDSIAVSSDPTGNFTFNNVKFAAFTLKAAFIGFNTFIKQYQHKQGEKVFVIPAIKLKENSNTLNEVVISGTPPVLVKEDTLQFNAKAYKVRDGDAVEEVIKKLPGVTVDKDGKVTSQGKPINKIRVNGKDFFGTDVASAIQNLPAEIVQNLQIIDDYGDQAKVTGIKSGEPEKILNINIQPDKKKGYFARGTGGMGNESRYIASARANVFKGERQISFEGGMNNTNLRGGGGNGITNNKTFGVNYKNEFNKKFSADGGYSFSNRDNETISSTSSQAFYTDSINGDFTRFSDSKNNSSSLSNSHNFWGNLEFKMDTLNYLKLSPNGSFSNSDNVSIGDRNIMSRKAGTLENNVSLNNSASANIGTSLFYNHKFLKKGRNISLWTSVNYSEGNNGRDAKTDYFNTDSLGRLSEANQYQYTKNLNDNFRSGGNLTYSEPMGKSSFLDLNYNLNFSDTKTSRDLNNIDPLSGERIFNAAQSNNYTYQFATHRAGFNYRFIHEKYNYSVGLTAQPVLLTGQDLSRDINTRKETFNWIPNARFVYRFSKQKTLTANYNGRSNQPGFNQIQPISDSTNLQNVVVGNKDLNPEFTQGINLDYNESDWKSGKMVYANLSFNQTSDKIVTTRIFIPNSTKQVTSYINTDGFYNLRGNYSYAKPFAERKFTVTYFGGGNFNNNIAFSSSQRNVAKNLVLDQGLKFRIDLKDIMDTELSTSYSVNKTQYSLSSFTDRKTNRLEYGVNGRNYFFKDITLGYDLHKTINKGFTSGNPNPTILNIFAEYRFLKGDMGTLRLNSFDLFNENTGITRDVFDNEIVDNQTNRLGRYFLLSFNLRLRKFG